ncbi:MAG: dTDP-glucose 4,6-dehydratase, partial [Oscillospiraceae bacterium]|nr:dTDP-glucose 4,6-dehydratase [Oscillospiraceae bacterium]
LGKEPEIRYVSRDIPQRNFFPFYDYAYILDTARQSGLMQELTPLRDGLCASYEWYREHRQFVRKKPLIGFIDENFR